MVDSADAAQLTKTPHEVPVRCAHPGVRGSWRILDRQTQLQDMMLTIRELPRAPRPRRPFRQVRILSIFIIPRKLHRPFPPKPFPLHLSAMTPTVMLRAWLTAQAPRILLPRKPRSTRAPVRKRLHLQLQGLQRVTRSHKLPLNAIVNSLSAKRPLNPTKTNSSCSPISWSMNLDCDGTDTPLLLMPWLVMFLS